MNVLAGIGVDIISIDRIARLHQRFGERFVHRLLGAREREQFAARQGRHLDRGYRFLATRYAAKEAFFKALGTGLRAPWRWTDLQVINEASGRPVFIFDRAVQTARLAETSAIHLSISDEKDWAVAYVVIEAKRSDPAASLPVSV